MKIALCTIGSTGDIQPFLALAVKLKAAGHDVRVLSHPFHGERFRKREIEFVDCGPVVEQEELNAMLDKMLKTVNPLRQLRLLVEEAFFAGKEDYFRHVTEGLKGIDLVVAHHVDFMGVKAADNLGIPRIGVVLAPVAVPTRYSGPAIVPRLGPLNFISWKLMEWMLRPIDRKVRSLLNELPGKTPKIKMMLALASELNLIAASPLIAPTYDDLPKHFEVTGPWILDEPEFEPEPALHAFLEKYPRPVMVSFGSMGGSKGPELTRKVLEALRIAKLPAVIQSGYAEMYAENAPANVFFAEYVPHGWLFPRSSCVVHHCGAGTSTAVCRAGVPSVPLVFIADQPYFATQLRRKGLAPKMIWHYRLRAKTLAKRILQTSQSPDMQKRSRELRQDFIDEEGTERAVKRIERFAHEKGILQSTGSAFNA